MYPQNPSLSILYSFLSLSLSWKNAKQKQTGGKSSFYLPPEIEKQGKSITEEVVPAQSIQEASKNFAYTREWKRRRNFFFISLLFAEKRKKIRDSLLNRNRKRIRLFFRGKKKRKKIHWVFRNWK